ncbi:MAG TPA: hypothetical protein VKU39_16860, partial [Streptosporangiaceae bacterium]|nr:hypothetical protein [Streptosporangiaceae bacterium]
ACTLLLVAVWYWRARPASPRRWPGTALALNALIVAAVPALVLFPWAVHLFAQPSSLLLEAGLASPGLATANLRPEPVLLLSPGGPGLPPLWVTSGLFAAALCALLLRRRPVLVRCGWAVALAGLLAAAAGSRFQVISPVSGGAIPAWPGAAMAVAAAGLLLAATPVLEWAVGVAWGVAASEAKFATRARLVGRRGAVALVFGALAVATPVAAAGAWLAHGVRGPVTAARAQVLPAFIAANSSGLTRTLVLRRPGGILTYELLRGRDPVLGEPELPQNAAASAALGTVVATLAAPASGDAEDAGQALSSFGIGWVLLPAPVDPALAAQLNSQAGLQSLASSPAYVVWRVADPIGMARVVAADGTVTTLTPSTAGGPVVVPAAAAGTLVLPEPAGGWSATLNGRSLTPLSHPVDGWAAGFVLPSGGGSLVIGRDNIARTMTLGAEALALLAAFVLALPGVRGAAEPEAPDSADAAEAAEAAEVAVNLDLADAADDTTVLERVSVVAAAEPSADIPTPARAWQPASDPWEDAWEDSAAPAWEDSAAPAWGEPAVPAWGEPAAHDWEPPVDPWEPVPVPVRDPEPTAPSPSPSLSPSPSRKGGSHRAARHSKPSRGFPLRRRNGDTGDALNGRQASPGRSAGAADSAGTEPGSDIELDSTDASRPPWDLGGAP